MQLYFYNGQSTNYQITEEGKLYNIKTNRWLKGQISKNGYITFNITLNDGTKKRLYAHRMVMMTYNPVEDMDLLEVNHIDGNKENNNIDNLEWTTNKQNKEHGFQNGLYDSVKKKVYCFNKDKKLIGEFETVNSASKICGVNFSGLSQALNKEQAPLFNGMYWRFTPDEDFEIFISETSTKKKRVGQYDFQGNLIAEYDSINAAANANNICRPNISKCCNGYLRSYKGFIWKFI